MTLSLNREKKSERGSENIITKLLNNTFVVSFIYTMYHDRKKTKDVKLRTTQSRICHKAQSYKKPYIL